MSRHPEVKWAERADKVYITVLLPDSKNAKVNLEPEGVFTFSANAGADNNLYESMWRKVKLVLESGAQSASWRKLRKCGGKNYCMPMPRPPIILKWTGTNGSMKMKTVSFGNMGGMDASGMDDFYDSSDDEEQEVTKLAEQDTIKVDVNAMLEEQGARTSEKREADART